MHSILRFQGFRKFLCKSSLCGSFFEILFCTAYLRKNNAPPVVAFSRSEEVPQATEAVHEEVRQLQSHLGISGTIIPDVYLRYYKLPRGIYVSQVAGNSEAQEKGLVAGDIITSLDGHTVHDNLMLDLWAAGLEEGDPIDLTIYRAGSEFTLTLNWSNFD